LRYFTRFFIADARYRTLSGRVPRRDAPMPAWDFAGQSAAIPARLIGDDRIVGLIVAVAAGHAPGRQADVSPGVPERAVFQSFNSLSLERPVITFTNSHR